MVLNPVQPFSQIIECGSVKMMVSAVLDTLIALLPRYVTFSHISPPLSKETDAK